MPGDGLAFYATGVSLVLHPRNPYVPTTHANFRFLCAAAALAGSAAAPISPPTIRSMRTRCTSTKVLRDACDAHDPLATTRAFKTWCDEYFFLRHRK